MKLLLLSVLVMTVFVTSTQCNATVTYAMSQTTPRKITKQQARERVTKLQKALNGKYFTTDQREDRNSGDERCHNVNVIKKPWLKNATGLVPADASLMICQYEPTRLGGSNAYSCYGFAAYAGWYVYAQKATDNVKSKKIYQGTFGKAAFDVAGLWPGDVIRVDCGNLSHSAIYISHNSYGVEVLDSNWGCTNYVQTHTISYSYYSGCAFATTRGTNYTTSDSGQDTPISNYIFKMKAAAYADAYNKENGSKIGRVYPGDVVSVKKFSTSGWLQVDCPWDGNVNKTIYIKAKSFKFKATKQINAYSDMKGKSIGKVYANDTVTVLQMYKNGYMRCSCPWDNGKSKEIYIKYKEMKRC